MRSDISKVLVTTPRVGSRLKNGEVLALRRERITEDYDGPRRTSMKPSHHRYCDRKQLNEYLNPLARFLQKQVGKRWDDVYSEICKHNKRGSAVGEHIFQHLFDYVRAKPTASVNEWYYHNYYVDESGILQKSPERKWPRFKREQPECWRKTDDELVWYVQRDDGCWFEWTLAPEPEDLMARLDMYRRRGPSGFESGLPTKLRHCGVLRTLSKAEKKALSL